ncbi:DNA replication complex GINS protein PSF3-like [Macrosteles quadrilineatus]|uniref:DNA replication complex GINS protein PSF3-like n=1 Tax=Macrosteles quadrilineatus TaxID=74068 RepID=UPI0023E15FBC|nr:DNA replication complex GINS protein PSF3-like [Macrosteles quadrilineatus]XP_054278263.1 DNA replication complex GINS protein PSF3-like [Macrosteles quadrilineatus]
MINLYRYKSHYFSIENILASQERVPCKFTKKILNMGHLDPSSETKDMEQGTSLELPYWIVKTLSNREVNVLEVEPPKIFKENYRDILKADANVVDLHKMCKFFYQFGKLLSYIETWNGREIRNMLVETFRNRFRQLMDWAQNMSADQQILDTLDHLEKQVLTHAREAQARQDSWLACGVSMIVAAEMIVNHKKRKLSALDLR